MPNKQPAQKFVVTPQGMTEVRQPDLHVDVPMPRKPLGAPPKSGAFADRTPYEGTNYGASTIAGMGSQAPEPAPSPISAPTAPQGPTPIGVRKPEDEPRAIGF